MSVRNRRIGVCTHFERREQGWKVENLLPGILDLGVGVVRQEIKWEDVEKEKGQFVIPEVDLDWLRQTEEAGLEVILLLCYGNNLYENPLDPEGFARFAGFMANELKGRHIISYEIWNEPTNFYFYNQYGGSFSGKEPCLWLDRFCELMALSAAAIREADPEAVIITNPGEVQTYHMMERYASSFENIDGVSHHPYTVRFPPETLPLGGGRIAAEDGANMADDRHSFKSLFDMTREHSRNLLGRELDMYITEYGFTSYNQSQKPGWPRGYNEPTQAAYSVRSLILGLKSDVRVSCLYDYMNDGTDPFEAEQNFGIIRHEDEGYVKKSVYGAVKRMLGVLGSSFSHLNTVPAQLSAPMLPLNQRYFWQEEAKEPFLPEREAMAEWFKQDERYVTFVWLSGRMPGEENTPVGRIFWPNAPKKLSKAIITDLVTGETSERALVLPRRSGMDGEGLILENIPVTGSPHAIQWG
ncbi:MAG: hypothetical protein JXR97_16765 [Planctomycetes bacterium]|nr:hypothetical protein [Planctomycetota bacterium]